jgi:putative endonuclease
VATKDVLGRRGEQLAVDFLIDRGLRVLARNWRCPEGELDVVAAEGPVLIVCEVKTRSGLGFGEPAEAVTARKAARIRRVTQAWLAERGSGWPEVRFDVLAVLLPPGGRATVQHYRAAF